MTCGRRTMEILARNRYYEVTIDRSRNRVSVMMKGAWSDDNIGKSFLLNVRRGMDMLSKGFTGLVDAKDLLHPPGEIGEPFRELWRCLEEGSPGRIIEVSDSDEKSEGIGEDSGGFGRGARVFLSREDVLAYLGP
jgi:hypothetical protein